MIEANVLPNGNIDYIMKSEDGQGTVQAKCSYTFKDVKKGRFATVIFDDEQEIEKQYDCAYSMLENTMPADVYCVVLGNKAKDKNYDTIVEAAKRFGFTEIKGKLIKNFA